MRLDCRLTPLELYTRNNVNLPVSDCACHLLLNPSPLSLQLINLLLITLTPASQDVGKLCVDHVQNQDGY